MLRARRLALLLLLAVSVLAAPRAHAIAPTNGSFNPLVFGPGQLGELQFSCSNTPFDPSLCDPIGAEATRHINVVNNSGYNWTDFHLRLVSVDDSIVFPAAPLQNPEGLLYIAHGTTLDLFGDIPNGGFFDLQFKLEWASPSTASLPPFELYGIPSIPEPASLALFGAGLAGLGLARRRRMAA